uniref:Reverse transcriptase Ty1/copia-type domain-containing protein n=1 Tax=Tanacetum cinerariifolium TaxID=118510 RepID=A0A699GN99_TANCI|nr:hypothetical protein [Tanacetum cinerariifolium]
MHQPPRFTDSAHSDYVCLIQKSLYGLKQAPRAWFQRFSSYVIRAGFYHSKTDSSLFIFHKGPNTAYLLLYVDDIILTASSTSILQRIIFLLHAEFAMTDLGPLNYFLGISAMRTTSGIFLSQTKYATEILEQHRCLIVILAGLQLTPRRSLDLKDHGSLILLYIAALPDHFRTTNLGLQLFRSTTSQLIAYSDADWKDMLSRSSVEAEYRGVVNVVVETSWIRNLLRELHTPRFTATLVYCDNVSAVYMSANPVQHQSTKHIEIDIYFVRDKVVAGHVRVLHVLSRFQYADIFTKEELEVLTVDLFVDLFVGLFVRLFVGLFVVVFVEEYWSHGAEEKDSFVKCDMTRNDNIVGVQVKAPISAMIIRVPEKDRWCGTRGKFVRWNGVRVTKASKRAYVGVRGWFVK